ncbi:MAG: hypothetical protein AB1633_13780, partial [Elusimicrobiota bacterium]
DAWRFTLRELDEYLKNKKITDVKKNFSRLGVTIAELHYKLMKAFGSDEFDKQEIQMWQENLTEGIIRAIALAVSRGVAEEIASIKDNLLKSISGMNTMNNFGKKLRIHNDLHLGQILKTRSGFCVIDFEGEPLKSPQENRKKNSPLKDIAGVLRSINYAANYCLKHKSNKQEELIKKWEEDASKYFQNAYFSEVKKLGCDFLPSNTESLNKLLLFYKLEKAMYELVYEINSRPDWIDVPVSGIKDVYRSLIKESV